MFRSSDRYHQLKQQRNKSLETEDRTALLPTGTTCHLCLASAALWDLGRNSALGRVEQGQAAASAQGLQSAPVHFVGQATRTDARSRGMGSQPQGTATPVQSPPVSTAQLIADLHAVPSCRGSTKEGAWGALTPLCHFLMQVNDAFPLFDSLFHPDSCPTSLPWRKLGVVIIVTIHMTYYKLFTMLYLKMPGKCLQH